MPPSNFHALGVPAPIATNLSARGIAEPFPIQTAVVPDALSGRDVIGRAPTGAGKTLAFGLPLVAGIERASKRRPTGLVLAPTRELAEQIATELAPLAKTVGRRVVSVYGGVGYGRQRTALDAGVDLVVACPGRLEDLLQMRALQLDDVGFVVIDEADRMADMGFLPAVRRIVDQTAPTRQTLLFSATLDGSVGKLSRDVQRDPVRHEIGPEGPDISAAQHVFWQVEQSDRQRWVADVAEQLGSVMIFCRTRHGADRVAKQLTRRGVTAGAIHGGRSQSQRDRALREFSAGKIQALVATDVAARGVHVDDVAAVVHFDPPEDASAYIHRSGRTARAGASGVVVSLCAPGTARAARKMLRDTGVDVTAVDPDLATLASPATASVGPDLTTPSPATASVHTEPELSRADNPDADDRGDAATTGTVVSFHPNRGFGFIDAGGKRDLFVHHSNLTSKIRPGQRVRFELRDGRRGPEAVAVQAI